jgi:hypothetical protein
MGIELYIVKIKDTIVDIFEYDNQEVLDIIGLKSISSFNSEIPSILMTNANIERQNKSWGDTSMCKSDDFEKVYKEIDLILEPIKKKLDEERDSYKKSPMLEFIKNNSYEKIENLLKDRLFEEYKKLLQEFVSVIETDLSDNYDLYEYDSYNDHKYLYSRIKLISDKLNAYSNTPNIYYFVSI